jgi:hypothetical protein
MSNISLNLVNTEGNAGAEGLIQSPYLYTATPGYNYGNTDGYLEYGAGTPGSLPFKVDQSGNVTATSFTGGAGAGTVTSVSVASANGFAGTVATATTTPAITVETTITGLLKGNGTAISAAVSDTDYQAPITLTTTGSSGAATFSGNTLNIPQYTGSAAYTSGQYLCAPTSYAPTTSISLTTTSTTMGAPSGATSTVASGSNGGEVSQIATWSSPSAGVLAVALGSAFPALGGTVNVAASGSTTAVVTYTGVSGNTLTGCAYVSGSATGTVSTGGAVSLTSPAIFTGNFTVPTGCNTVVVTAAFVDSNSGGEHNLFNLAAYGGVTPMVSYAVGGLIPSGSQRRTTVWLVSVIPTDTYNFALMGCVDSGTLSIGCVGNSSTTPTGSGGPAIMTVQAV